MTVPTATYRIQFRNGMTFDRAAGLVPYIKRLGASHLYASPIFTATSESTHGYDVTDANEIDPVIGGREGFDRMVQALKAAGLGLILDIVPNHMASSLENPWWRDVIENGERSRYARHFDIDWSRRLTLPFLGDDAETEIASGALCVKAHPHTGRPALAYYESFYPLTPESYAGNEAGVLALTDAQAIADLHDRQPWRLMCWRDAPRELSYRRFFEITGLVGVRVEDDTVFDDTHRLILELVHSGAVDGLRVDHVDGLADPKGYLERLRQKAGDDCYITVEKILGEGEHLPADWPISGTTGYEFIASLSDVLVDDDRIDELRRIYDDVVGKPVDMKAELRAAKLLMVDRNFEGEFTTLLRLACGIARRDNVLPDENAVRQALREMLIAFPVYRTYGTPDGLPEADLARVQEVAQTVKNITNGPEPQAVDFVVAILAGNVSEQASADAALFRTRFQQLTGPLMAKSVEDTLFFRQNMDLALNEVGAEPLPRAFSLARFHDEMQTRLKKQPDALSSTSTHDTKRGEDARARLYTLTEAPEQWAQCVARWRQINQSKVVTLADGTAPKLDIVWMLYQALAGAWPATLAPHDVAGLKDLEDRFVGFVEKALREAKRRTDWIDSNDPYEQAVFDYARHLLSPENAPFLQDFSASLQPFIRAGLTNSLTQTVIKLTAPGVPDIYQGSEALNFSLVDPDNRREPDFARLTRQLDGDPLQANWANGQLKQQVTARLLSERQRRPALFRKGAYLQLTATGEQAQQVIAYARVHGDDVLIVIAPRRVFNVQGALWAQTTLALPAALAHRRYRNLLSGEEQTLGETLSLERTESSLPILILTH
nr:malto-oligosyltrehalose synthase [uncultured Enterobacter sp.]